jgi:hypothetical protein
MRERVKVFTFLCGTGATVIESPLEDQVNAWLESFNGEIVRITHPRASDRMSASM